MSQLYVLRRFSSWSFRLSVSMALLVSSAGLATSLLVGTPLGDASLRSPAWKPAPALVQVASELATGQRAAGPVLPVALSNLGPAYSLTTSVVYDAPLLNPTSLAANQAGSFDPTPLPTTGTLRATVQRSWRAFKLAFR
ncbi:MAG: hypothetical protein EOO36_01000 [Cytophagaceae bacterium]|nr:MAG: hypothetical protein EOO36_01000 [Cytophagaceae bacterium]